MSVSVWMFECSGVRVFEERESAKWGSIFVIEFIDEQQQPGGKDSYNRLCEPAFRNSDKMRYKLYNILCLIFIV